jgi:hypothetical protein
MEDSSKEHTIFIKKEEVADDHDLMDTRQTNSLWFANTTTFNDSTNKEKERNRLKSQLLEPSGSNNGSRKKIRKMFVSLFALE